MSPASPRRSELGLVVRTVAVRPWLWGPALVTAARLAPAGWWRRWPPIPRPPEAYWRFRMETAFGSQGSSAMAPHDVVAYLRWCRRMPG